MWRVVVEIFVNTFLNILPVGVFILNKNFTIIEVNACIERFFGMSREQMVGKDKRKLIIEKIASIWEDPDAFTSRVFAAYDSNSYIQNFTAHVLSGPNRKERWLSHFSEPILSGEHAGGRVEIYTDITDQMVAEEHINWLSSHIMYLQDKERARIARDLHDELGQRVVAQKMMLENLANQLHRQGGDVGIEETLRNIIQDFGHLGREVQRISSDLAPSLLEPLGLHGALNLLKDKAEELHQLKITYQTLGVGEHRFPQALEVVIFRIFQEGLSNIIKHAQAQHVELKLLYSYPKIIISIADDGVGFSSQDSRPGLGLRFMRQRVSEVGGLLRIKSQPGQGTTLRLEIPYYQDEASA